MMMMMMTRWKEDKKEHDAQCHGEDTSISKLLIILLNSYLTSIIYSPQQDDFEGHYISTDKTCNNNN